jgi:hypothetical protein
MGPMALKIASIALSIGGAVIAVATNIIDDKKLDDKVAEKVAKALENK